MADTFLVEKQNDPPLRGRADYILSVAGAARWVLEIKAPQEAITQDAIEQAISYARHPEVAGVYAAILNGRKFVVMHYSQRSDDTPILELDVSSANELTGKVQGLLSPAAIARDCSPPIVDVNQPLADGLRSCANIRGGAISYTVFEWASNFSLPFEAAAQFDKICQIFRGYRANVTGGCAWRDKASRIRARLDWSVPHDEMLKFTQEKGLMEWDYISLSNTISRSSNEPTLFDVVGNLTISKGDPVYNMVQWDTKIAEIATSMTYRGQATGHIEGATFCGTFQGEYEATFPTLPVDLRINLYALGTFEVDFDPR
jgi:hypothetical protein